MSNQLKAVIRSRKPLHEGFLQVYEYEFDVEKHGGGIARLSREVMERGNAVAVLGHDPIRDEVVLGNEFRPGLLVAANLKWGRGARSALPRKEKMASRGKYVRHSKSPKAHEPSPTEIHTA